MAEHYDIAVIGSGAGTKIAHHAANAGYRVAFIEKGPFGGTCVNRGCIPSKMLIYPSDVVHAIRNSGRLNIQASVEEIDFSGLVHRVTGNIDTLAQKIQSSYRKRDNVDVFASPCRFLADKKLEVEGETITADRIYLAIGALHFIPDIEGLDQTPYLTSDQALRLDKKPQKLVVIGGGFIAAEMGHYFATMGAEVETISRSGFLNKIDETIRQPFLGRFRLSHCIHEFAKAKRVSHDSSGFSVHFTDEDGKEKTAQGDTLLVATGMRGCTEEIGIEKTSIQMRERGFIQVDDHLKTDAPDTWAFGDCLGRAMFRHTANFEGDYLKKQLLGEEPEAPIQYPPIPFAIFTHPQIGVVGKTEEELKKEGIPYVAGVAEYENSDMGKARQSRTGLVKLLFHADNRRLLSAHIIGDEAATMIHVPIAYIQTGAVLDDLIETIFIHPALPEVISSAAYDAKKKFQAIDGG